MARLRVGQEWTATTCCAGSSSIQYTRNDLAFTRGTFRVRGDTIEVFPVYEEHPVRIEMFGDEVERLMTLHPVTGEVLTEDAELYIFPATHYVAGPERMERAIAGIEAELERAAGRARAPGQAARGAAAAHAHHLRPRDDAPGRLLLRHRELLAGTSTAARPGTAPTLPARLLPRGLPPRHRRVARDRAADRRHVRGRHEPQAQPRRARVPAAERDGQPPAALGGVPRAHRPDRLPLGDPGPVRARRGSTTTSSSRSSARPASSTPRSS